MDDVGDKARLASSELAWVRQVARALVRDNATADDLAQDAWLIASKRAPVDGRPLRPWLSRVVLNLVRMRSRAAKRREAREIAASEPAVALSPEEIIARVEWQRALAGEVLALKEPYRTTVLLHFVDGLSCAEIARRLDLPDGTVRRRLKVALDQLRGRLRDRDDVPPGGWLAILIPLSQLPSETEAAPASSSISVTIWIAFVALVLAIATIVAISSSMDAERVHSVPRPTVASSLQRTKSAAIAIAGVPSWLVQPGVAAKRVAGRVTADGQPVAGATVRLAFETVGRFSIVIADQTTGTDGTFEFGTQPAATYVLSAQAEARMPRAIVVDLARPGDGGEHIVLDLEDCTSRLVGTIRDASGGVIPKARITVAGRAGSESAADGTYAVCIPTSSRVRVEADGYESVELSSYLVGTFSKDILLAPETIVVGRVVDEGDAPVSDASVLVTPEGIEALHEVASRTSTTDRDGTFRVTGVGPGRMRVSAIAGTRVSDPATIVAMPGTTTTEVPLVIRPRARVYGHVRMNGAPVVGARVSLVAQDRRLDSEFERALVGTSQTDGSFTIDGVGSGRFGVSVSGFELVSAETLVVDRPFVSVSVEVAQRASIRGRIVQHGKPVPNAEVAYFWRPSMPIEAQPLPSTTTDQNGTFALEGIRPGEGRLWANSIAGKTYGFRDLTITGAEDKRVELELGFAGRISGRVVDESSRPVQGVYVRVTNGEGDEGWAMTDAAGTFDCFALLGGTYKAEVFPTPAAQQSFAARSGHQGIRVRDGDERIGNVELVIVHDPRTLRGRVVDRRGAPVPDTRVVIAGSVAPYTHVDGMSFKLPWTLTDRGGQFEFRGLAPGDYALSAHAPDGSRGGTTRVSAGSIPVEVELVPPGRIEGTLVGFTTTPFIETFADVAGFRARYVALVRGDRFTLEGLPPGTHTLVARTDRESTTQRFEVKSRMTTDIVVQSQRFVDVEVQVTEFGTASPIQDVICTAIELPLPDRTFALTTSPHSGGNGVVSFEVPRGVVEIACGSTSGFVAGGVLDTTRVPRRIELVAGRVSSVPHDVGFAVRMDVWPPTIDRIDLDGPAAVAGLRIGDVIVALDGVSVDGLSPLALTAWLAGRTSTLVTVQRSTTSTSVVLSTP